MGRHNVTGEQVTAKALNPAPATVVAMIGLLVGMLLSAVDPGSLRVQRAGAAQTETDDTPTSRTLGIDFTSVAHVPDEFHDALTTTLSASPSVPADVTSLVVTSFRRQGDWALAVAVDERLIDSRWESGHEGAGILDVYLYRSGDGGWDGVVATDPAFDQLKPLIPPSFVEFPANLGGAQVEEYRFPWTAGQRWYKVGVAGGWHQGNALDFQPVVRSDPPVHFAVLAAASGTVSEQCNDGTTITLRMTNGDGTTVYAHMDAGTVRRDLYGRYVSRGQYLGLVYYPPGNGQFSTACGYGVGVHLHFVFPHRDIVIDGNSANAIAASAFATQYTSTNPRIDNPSPPPTCGAIPTNAYCVEYFNGTGLGGSPVAAVQDSAPLAHDWGPNPPAPGVGASNFSARWRGNFAFAGGEYVFRVNADDGVRVKIDGNDWFLNEWRDQGNPTFTVRITIPAGTHLVTVEYFNNVATGAIGVFWELVTPANRPPVANAGQDRTVEDADSNGSHAVTLDGRGSSDPDGVIASYVWREGEAILGRGATPSVTLGVGTHTIVLTVTDSGGMTASDTVIVTVKARPKLVLDKESSKFNGVVTASLTWFPPNTPVSLRWPQRFPVNASDPPSTDLLAAGVTDAQGRATLRFRTPLQPFVADGYVVTALANGGARATDTLRVIPRIMLNEEEGTRSTRLRVYFYGFAPNERIEVRWHAGATNGTSYVELTTLRVASNGRASAIVTIPRGAAVGRHLIVGKVIGVSRSASTTFTLLAGGSSVDDETATPTSTPSATVTATPDATGTPEATTTPEPTATSTPEPTATPTAEPAPTETPTPEPTATATPEPTATATPEPTATPTATPEPLPEPTATPTSTPAIVPEEEGA